MGWWVFSLFTWFVATGYFFLNPRRMWNSVRFYGALFPERGWTSHVSHAWRQYHGFTKVFMDRVLLQKPGDTHFVSEGLEHLQEASAQKTGGIILMSHAGNWEVAVRLLKDLLPGMDLLLYMGIKHKEQIEGIQKSELDQAGIKIVAVGSDGGSPFDLVEGINLLKDGGFVSMTGDILWHKNQRSVQIHFLEHEVSLPQAPHLLALLSGKPLFVFFSFRNAKGEYLFKASRPIFVQAATRTERNCAIRESAQSYARILEQNIREHPHQWYHFEPFLGRKIH